MWRARHEKLPEQRVFKFCFRADRVRSLKREMTLFRVLKERVGDHPNIVRLLEVYKTKFQYDPIELKAVVEDRDQSASDWLRGKVTFDAAYPSLSHRGKGRALRSVAPKAGIGPRNNIWRRFRFLPNTG